MKNLLKFSLLLNGILVIITGLFFVFFPGIVQGYRQAYLENYHQRQVSIFQELPRQKNAIVFLGASLMEEANWAELFQNPRVINRGISGDQTKDILGRIDSILVDKPAKIFVQGGYNDFNNGQSMETVLENHQKILEKIADKSPQTLVYLISLMPIRYEELGEKVKIEQLIITNGKLRELAQKKGVAFIDVFTSLQTSPEEQQLNPKYSNDGLHLLGEGYIRLKAVLDRYVNDDSALTPPKEGT